VAEPSLTVLLVTALGLALLHTVIGPDHYLPFVVLGRAEGWSLRRTMLWTLLCGLGHILSSIVIGGVGIAVGWSVASMEGFEGVRGEIASWAMIGFGLLYMAWGLLRARRGHVHTHVHADGSVHCHGHDHADGRGDEDRREAGAAHDEDAHVRAHRRTVWTLFIVFVLGPCEPLIPLLMVPASDHSAWGVALVAAVFGLATIAAMMVIVAAGHLGLRLVRLGGMERWAHAASGAAIAASGAAITFLGL
jgi:nickel/cobalt exporter